MDTIFIVKACIAFIGTIGLFIGLAVTCVDLYVVSKNVKRYKRQLGEVVDILSLSNRLLVLYWPADDTINKMLFVQRMYFLVFKYRKDPRFTAVFPQKDIAYFLRSFYWNLASWILVVGSISVVYVISHLFS